MIRRLRLFVAIAQRGTRRFARSRPLLTSATGSLLITFAVLGILACTGGNRRAPTSSEIASRTDQVAAPVWQFQQEPVMRVLLRRDMKTVDISADSGVVIRAQARQSQAIRFGKTVRISRAAGSYRLFDVATGQGKQWPVRTLLVRPNVPGETLRTSAREYTYHGQLRLVMHNRNESGVFDVVNDVPTEQYIPGVLDGELYGHWHPEAFQAQAIAARSYAIARKATAEKNGRHFDVYDTVASQKFNGASRNPKSIHAAEDTYGVALTWRDEVLCAYYSSTSGGAGQDAHLVFPGQRDLPPLRGRSHGGWSSSSHHHQWGPIDRPVETLSRRIAAYGSHKRIALRNLKTIRDIRITERNLAGRPTNFRISDVTGKHYNVSAEAFRNACNFKARGLPELGNGKLKSSFVDIEMYGSSVRINGRGYGHGVGLCQFGSQAMAQAGYKAEAIVAFYYQGAQLKKLYDRPRQAAR